MNVSRRAACENDEGFARDTHHKAFRDVALRQFGAWDEALQDQFFAQEWAKARMEIVLLDGVPCGYLCVSEAGGHVELHELVLHPDFHGRKIGTRLVGDIQQQAAARKVPVKLQVLHKNKAQELYARLGFAPCGRTDTHILMEWHPA